MKTTGELYTPAMQVESEQEARDYMEFLVTHHMETWHKSREESEATVRQNIGYYAGYFDQETFDRVMRLYGVEHPVFGKDYPHPDQFYAGM